MCRRGRARRSPEVGNGHAWINQAVYGKGDSLRNNIITWLLMIYNDSQVNNRHEAFLYKELTATQVITNSSSM